MAERIYLHVTRRPLLAMVVVALWASCCVAAGAYPAPQEPQPPLEKQSHNPLEPLPNPAVPTVAFDWVTLGAEPQHFSISVESSGRAALQISDQPAPDETPAGEPFLVRFYIPEAERQRIFRWAEAANYFNGNFDYTRHRIANTGAKTLTYADPQRRFSTTYNWSEDKSIQQLTNYFSGIYWTEYYGRRLAQQHRFDKLALNDTLSAMVGASKRGELSELQLVQSILQAIAEDGAVMNIARMRARQLLQRIPATATPESSAASK